MFDFNLFKPEPLLVNEGKEQSPAKMQFDFKRRTAKVDLCLLVNEINGRLFLGFEYCTKLFKKETVDFFLKYLQRIIEQVTKNEKIKIEEIELLDVNEKLDISSVLQKDRESITVDLAI